MHVVVSSIQPRCMCTSPGSRLAFGIGYVRPSTDPCLEFCTGYSGDDRAEQRTRLVCFAAKLLIIATMLAAMFACSPEYKRVCYFSVGTADYTG